MTAYTPGALSEAATNLCTNGSFETNTSGWANGTGGTITRTTAEHKFGSAAGQIVYAGSVVNEYVGYPITPPSIGAFVAGLWMKAPAGSVLQITLAGSANNSTPFVGTADWQFVSARVTNTAIVTTTLYVATYSLAGASSPQAITVYIDGAHIEAGSTPEPYVELTPIA